MNNMTVTSKMLEIPQVQSILLPNQVNFESEIILK